jgi:hypothetical protein
MGLIGFLKKKKIIVPKNYSEKVMFIDERLVKVIKENGAIRVLDGNREIYNSKTTVNGKFRLISFQQWLKIQKANEVW